MEIDLALNNEVEDFKTILKTMKKMILKDNI